MYMDNDNFVQKSLEDDDTLKEFRVKLSFNKHSGLINSISYSPHKNYLMSSAKDDKIIISDIESGKIYRNIINPLGGCSNALFTNHGNTVLASSSKDYRIIQWNPDTKEKIFCFLGHYKEITDISIHPLSEKYFITSSLDEKSRLWDLSKRSCVFIFEDSRCATFNPQGNLLASISCEYNKLSHEYINYLNIYSFTEIQEGPFKVFTIQNMSKIHQIKFSNDGLLIFVKDENNKCAVFNIFDSNLVKIINPGNDNHIISNSHISTAGYDLNTSYIDEKFELFNFGKTEDYLAFGSKEGKIYIWNTATNYDKAYIVNILEEEKSKNSNLIEPCNCIKFCKEKNILATGGSDVTIWGLY